MIAVGFAVVAAVLFGGLTVAVRFSLLRCQDPQIGAVAMLLVAFATSCVFALPSFAALPDIVTLWPLLLAGAITPGASQILFVHSVREIGPSRTAILVGTSPLLSVALAVVVLGEPLGVGAALGALLIVAGGSVLTINRGNAHPLRLLGVASAASCAFLYAVRDNVVRHFSRAEHIPATIGATVMLIAALAVVLLYVGPRRPEAFRQHLPTAVSAFALPGLMLALAITSLLAAFNRGEVRVVAPITATHALWASILALILLRSVDAVGRRTLLAAVLVLCGGSLVALAR